MIQLLNRRLVGGGVALLILMQVACATVSLERYSYEVSYYASKAQVTEIALHNAGKVNSHAHDRVQQFFAALGTSIIEINAAIRDKNKGLVLIILDRILTAIDSINNEVPFIDRQGFDVALSLVRTSIVTFRVVL